jgi:hypothetical protein
VGLEGPKAELGVSLSGIAPRHTPGARGIRHARIALGRDTVEGTQTAETEMDQITVFQDLPDYTGLRDFTLFLVYVAAFLFLAGAWQALRDSRED